jgi:hypothetical protein
MATTTESKSKAAGTSGAIGFAFERRVGILLDQMKVLLPDDWVMIIHTEQGIREFFKEQSLNGVDHMIQIQTPEGSQHLFFIQEKWKLLTNQREVSQFLDCCARILARMPDYKGAIHRLWVSRTVPSQNGDKSLQEGQCILVQTCTSQSLLAFNTILVISEIINQRSIAIEILKSLSTMLPNAEEAIVDPKVAEDLEKQQSQTQNTYQPVVSDFGEKRVLPITNKTVVLVRKVG